MIIGCLLLSLVSYAKDLTLVCTGEGPSKELAVRSALLEAIEQAYGSFISSNTEILNDELIKDEIVNLRRGNIKKYNVLSEIKTDTNVFVTVETVVSTDKLIGFAVSKGSEAELAGSTFAMNVKLAKLNLRNAVETLKQLYESLSLLAPVMYDYILKIEGPVLWNNKAYVYASVHCGINANALTFYDSFNSVRSAIIKSLKSSTIGSLSNEPEMAIINDYLYRINDLTSAWCLGFVIEDNAGNKILPAMNLNDVHGYGEDSHPQRREDKLLLTSNNANLQVIDLGHGIEYGDDNWYAYLGCLRSIGEKWVTGNRLPSVDYYLRNLIYDLIEVSHDPERGSKTWFAGRLDGRRPYPKKGEVNGVVRFWMVYDVGAIEQVTDIKVKPLGTAKNN